MKTHVFIYGGGLCPTGDLRVIQAMLTEIERDVKVYTGELSEGLHIESHLDRSVAIDAIIEMFNCKHKDIGAEIQKYKETLEHDTFECLNEYLEHFSAHDVLDYLLSKEPGLLED